ncbi:M48 family metalloprotease [Zophobihabitans entericus]|uniref:M48 family metalloprotease n=1 Tax=Zophobihabitans entericus TaxID=1635327 RepID=A0A6G9I7Q8_9GAMM|nr:M48 family metalloprotease [Zophobihabitans entericus]QIQ20248.1 M48 family metalloprotease [Zophobihabitans entericus]
MKQKVRSIIAASVFAVIASGCQQISSDSLVGLGTQTAQVMSLTNQEVKTLSDDSCAAMDAESKIAPASSPYTARLNKIADTLGHDINGTAINYKVYLTSDVNAWAMANGCVRVYSGLMDLMTDNEIQGVLGHELGHVALGHSKRSIQVAYGAEIARGAIAATTSGILATLTKSQIGDLAQQVVTSQFSQHQETEADNYSFDFLVKKGINPVGIATAFEKLGGGEATLLSTHPSSSDRSKNIYNRIEKLNQSK